MSVVTRDLPQRPPTHTTRILLSIYVRSSARISLVRLALRVLRCVPMVRSVRTNFKRTFHFPVSARETLCGCRLTPDQIRVLKAKRAHAEWHKKHAGHEKMHAEMLLVLLLTMVLTQVGCPCCLMMSPRGKLLECVWMLREGECSVPCPRSCFYLHLGMAHAHIGRCIQHSILSFGGVFYNRIIQAGFLSRRHVQTHVLLPLAIAMTLSIRFCWCCGRSSSLSPTRPSHWSECG